MKTYRKFKGFWYAALLLSLEACKLDNYEAPSATLYGSIVDIETQELVEQDITRGAVIELKEHGYDPVQSQYLLIKNDGTYKNSMLFPNTYSVQPIRTNFQPVPAEDIEIKGAVQKNFLVIPYVRVKDSSIAIEGNEVVARFRLEKTVNSDLVRIGLYGYPEPEVGEPIHRIKAERIENLTNSPDEPYELRIRIPEYSTELKAGASYFFRVGALINVSEARFNYAPVTKLEF